MRRGLRLAISAGVLVAVLGGGTGAATSQLARAEAAALAHTGEGRVTGTEVGDEESYYEIEVTLDDGTQVDVQLDRALSVVGDESDDDEGTDDD
jgi:hypothetical protein